MLNHFSGSDFFLPAEIPVTWPIGVAHSALVLVCDVK